MKRLCALMVLMVVSSAADAGTYSFSFGGHRYRIEAPRGCRSSSCASISTIGDKKRDDDTRDVAAPPPPPAPAPVQVAPPAAPAPAPVQQFAPPVQKPVIAAAPAPAPVAVYKPAAVATTEVAPPPLPPVAQAPQPIIVTQPCPMPPADRLDEAVRPAPAATSPPVLKVLHEEDLDSPVGDWLTEGRGMVRIAECGRSLCGYAIKEGDDEKGEAVLINMKSKSDQQWGGSVYSKDSGDTYYGTMRLKGPNMLRVEACAFGRFYCNGNNWTRISSKPLVTSRHVSEGPRT
jgi:hypothetical protein